MFAFDPQPVPAPTVTVTETVIVPTSIPAPIIAPPDPAIDWVKDVLFGDFGGAAIGAAVAIAVAYRLMNREREERLDDRRRDLAMQVCTELEGFLNATRQEGDMTREQRMEARLRLSKLTELTSILKSEEHKDPHKVFRDWLGKYERRLMEAWALQDDLSRTRTIATRFLAGVQLWHANPRPWQKAKSAEHYDPQLREGQPDHA
ncbi:hypothetical protein [Nonomuraea sp. NPDC049400]|uniref:hypothetical protein n=1 Tax=Nonomuraea sp. NPDC049400 TaxID=3364352 RepID=UPI0037B04DDC